MNIIDIIIKNQRIKKTIWSCFLQIMIVSAGIAQSNGGSIDSTINNLIHAPGYKTSQYGDIPHFVKAGKGRQTLILIPGLGFDASVFDDFMQANKNNYTMYAVTIPGYGETAAPPMPKPGTSYGDQSWNKGVQQGIRKLIKNEKIKKAVFVGHFVQGTQLVLQMAIDYPDITGGVIILGGPAKYISIVNGEPKEFPLKGTISYIDKVTAPNWFQTMRKENFDDGNYNPEIYSLNETAGTALWKQSAAISLPVMVRYLCEFFSADVKLDLSKIKCPVLVLRAMFNEKVLSKPINNYVKPQFIDSWEGVSITNSLMEVRDIQNAASFVWKDQPEEVYAAIRTFLNKKKLSIVR